MTVNWISRGVIALAALALSATAAFAQLPAYNPIKPTMADKTVVLTGDNLTVEQVLQVARHGAKVAVSPAARQRGLETFQLMNQAAAEGVSVYLFNRAAGSGREIVTFTGDPMSPENRPKLEARSMNQFRNGGRTAYGPEFLDEEVVRAMMVVRLNQMTYLPASPQLLQGLIDLLNNDITPVMRSRSGTGEAQGPSAGPMNAALVGANTVYLKGVRMPASEALAKVGMKPITPAPGDGTLGSINADVGGMSAILVADAKAFLDWVDLAYAVDLNGMNSSLTPLFQPVQKYRPYKWINWTSARLLDMMKGSYLFQKDPTRIIQDPESLRAGYVRQGSAWEEWAALRDAVEVQINGSEHNPATVVGAKPSDSWELATPQAMQYFVKGGPANNNKSGYVFSNANWDPYPLANRVEAFTIALANMDVAVMLRRERFRSTFFTVVKAEELVDGDADTANLGWVNHEVWQTIQGLINPVPPEGYCEDAECVEELAAESLFKVKRSMQALDESWRLVAADLVTGMRWIDVRKAQDPSRSFGPAVTAAHAAYRAVVPRRAAADAPATGVATMNFIKATPALTYYPNGLAMPK